MLGGLSQDRHLMLRAAAIMHKAPASSASGSHRKQLGIRRSREQKGGCSGQSLFPPEPGALYSRRPVPPALCSELGERPWLLPVLETLP